MLIFIISILGILTSLICIAWIFEDMSCVTLLDVVIEYGFLTFFVICTIFFICALLRII